MSRAIIVILTSVWLSFAVNATSITKQTNEQLLSYELVLDTLPLLKQIQVSEFFLPSSLLLCSSTQNYTELYSSNDKLQAHSILRPTMCVNFPRLFSIDSSLQKTNFAYLRPILQGQATFPHPLTLPPGRQNLQPQLELTYNSEAPNSWCGLGWSLTLPAITIDTRWGVPRYDQALETETYLLKDQQLSPVAHRATLEARSTGDKTFYLRIEGNFHRIIRHGDSPQTYWWEVTDKNGVHYYYGGLKDSGLDVHQVLRDEAGNIARWPLLEIRDPNDNLVRYHYTPEENTGLAGGQVPGHQVYLTDITYTGHGLEEGKYRIQFLRDRDLNEPTRPDVIIDGRLGLKQVTADRLRQIIITLDDQPIRSYDLQYTLGAFQKSLLASITELDSKGNDFQTHRFSYFDDIRRDGAFIPYADGERWRPKDDKLRVNFDNPVENFHANATALSGIRSEETGFDMSLTQDGYNGNLNCKNHTIGANFGYADAEQEAMVVVIDINGDQLPDKVFYEAGGLHYRANASGPNSDAFAFEDPRPILGVTQFYHLEQRSTSAGIEGQTGSCDNIAAFMGLKREHTQSTTSVYFADANGDGLLDIVLNGRVWYNHLGEHGEIILTESSDDTPNPIDESTGLDNNMATFDSLALETAVDQHPLHDIVRLWQAPMDGRIAVSGNLRLLADDSPERQAYTSADGVRVSVEYQDSIHWSLEIGAEDYDTKTPQLDTLSVQAGEKILFRVHSRFDGAFDQVAWNPTIAYVDYPQDLVDANNKPVYRYTAADDFLISAPISVTAPIRGTIRVDGRLVKPVTSDSIRLEIWSNKPSPMNNVLELIYQKTYRWNETADELLVPIPERRVLVDDEFWFRITSNSNVEWSAIQWEPHLYYTATEMDTPYPTEVIINERDTLLEYYPIVNLGLYDDPVVRTTAWTVPDTNFSAPQLRVAPILDFSRSFFAAIDVTFSVKRPGGKMPLAKTLTVQNGQIIAPEDPAITVPYEPGESLFIEYHVKDRRLAENLDTSEVLITLISEDNPTDSLGYREVVGFHSFREKDMEQEEYIFGPLYRNWGHFVYNGNRERATLAIVDSTLTIDTTRFTRVDSIILQTDLESLHSLAAVTHRPEADLFVMLFPNRRLGGWSGYDHFTYIRDSVMSSSRMGRDDLIPVSPIPTGTQVRAVLKITEQEQVIYSVDQTEPGEFPVAGHSGRSETSLRIISDFRDLNGDGYPDNVVEDDVQYTTASGGLETDAASQTYGATLFAESESKGITINGAHHPASTLNATASAAHTDLQQTSFEIGNAHSAGGLRTDGEYASGVDTVYFSWIDINGDQLPDRVYKDGWVALNLGYRFAPRENWGYDTPLAGMTISYSDGGTLGIAIGSGSILAGYGQARAESTISRTLKDMNGDGLVDELIEADQLMVRFNTGNGFTDPIPWNSPAGIGESAYASESRYQAFTVGLPLPFSTPTYKVAYNPGQHNMIGIGKETATFKDIDGDGYPDFLTSNKDDNLVVYRSTIGRTNKLKEVERPLGATISLDYRREGNTTAMPNSIWALSSIRVFDGFAGDGADTIATAISYADGYYDRREREFFGFATVRISELDTENGDAVYRTVERTYNNENFYEKGLLLTEVLLDGAENTFLETNHTYSLRDVQTGTELTEVDKHSDSGAAFPALIGTRKKYYEGQDTTAIQTEIQFRYDRFGNLTHHLDLGKPGASDDRLLEYRYHYLEGPYVVATPSSEILTDANGEIFRKKETSLYPGTGQVEQLKIFLSDSQTAVYDYEYDAKGNLLKVLHPENHRGQRQSYAYSYDGVVASYPVQEIDAEGYTSSFEYDYRYGQLTRHTDINGQEWQITVDSVGRIDRVTGPNELADGRPYTLQYDYYPNDSIPWARTQRFDPAHPENPLETIVFTDGLERVIQQKEDIAVFAGAGQEDVEQMSVSGRLHFDAFGRITDFFGLIAEDKEQEGLFNPEYGDIPPHRTSYDVLDRITGTQRPDGGVTSHAYTFGEDRDGRLQFNQVTTNAKGNVSEKLTDCRELLVATKRYLNGSPVWTSYRYDVAGDTTEILDDLENATTFAYDWTGNITARTIPGAGLTTYAYDQAGHLTGKTTANLRAVSEDTAIEYLYQYDRLTDIRYPLHPRNNVKYDYGPPGAADYRAGRVIFQGDGTGYQLYFYDRLGFVTKNIRHIIVIPNRPGRTYTTRSEYDTWGRINRLTYPDTEELAYTYNLGGRARSVAGQKLDADYDFIRQIGYNRFGQEVFRSYGNDVNTRNAYNPLNQMLTRNITTSASGRPLTDNNYTYDLVYNLLNLRNDAPLPQQDQMGGPTAFNFTYDDLDRLVGAEGHWQSSGQQQEYRLELQLNTVDHRLRKQQLHRRKLNTLGYWQTSNFTTHLFDYSYGSTPVGRPEQIGNWLYEYDHNGNLIRREEDFFFGQQRLIEWDEENRMRSLDDDERSHSYVYDADDHRTTKREEVGQFIYINGELVAVSDDLGDYTVYVNPLMEVSAAGYTKHYFLNGLRIGAKVGLGGPFGVGSIWGDWEGWFYWEPWDNWANDDNWRENAPPYSDNNWQDPDNNWNDWQNNREFNQYFFHSDIWNNHQYITDLPGEVTQHLEYFPRGELFVQEHKVLDRFLYLYKGQEMDEETNLYYYKDHYYNPQTIQWMNTSIRKIKPHIYRGRVFDAGSRSPNTGYSYLKLRYN